MTSFIQKIMTYEMYTKRDLIKEPVNFRKLFSTVFKEIKQSYPNVKSFLEFETGLPKISADPILIGLAINNLMSNALKFSSKRALAKITVGCSEIDGDYVIYIKDNGAGFDMAFADKLFTPFQRLHDSQDYEGSGLGLASVKNIIHKHGGKTWIVSVPREGTVVYFTLPKD